MKWQTNDELSSDAKDALDDTNSDPLKLAEQLKTKNQVHALDDDNDDIFNEVNDKVGISVNNILGKQVNDPPLTIFKRCHDEDNEITKEELRECFKIRVFVSMIKSFLPLKGVIDKINE